MKKWNFIFSLLIPIISIFPKLALANNMDISQKKPDTVLMPPVNKKEDKVIEEVIESKDPVKKEKVEYLSQVTKYGFKDLFKNYSYNSGMPYSSQVNPHAESYMQDYLQEHTKYLQKLKQNSMSYFNFIDGILVKYGLPKELKYLAVIESDLKSSALSTAGARGPWQFMSYTAKDYGLIVNQDEDDRTDYAKSTNAAAKYLLNLYKDLKDWLLVIAAYNGGPGRVYSAIRKSGSRNFWNLQYYLPEESRNHVKKFIATHYIMETGNNDAGLGETKFNYSNLSAGDSTLSTPKLSETEKSNVEAMPVSGRFKAAVISKSIEMDAKDFDHYNPGFDDTLASGASYNLQLPNDKMKLFVANKYSILNECVKQLLGSANIESMGTKTVYKNRNNLSKNRK
ncbi:MAG: lytic transglycosylase domain-containing protein [Bacteroidota bacterium]|nr:lytic transglycosylase domain-containing protein [Bacteroidota bacterium]